MRTSKKEKTGSPSHTVTLSVFAISVILVWAKPIGAGSIPAQAILSAVQAIYSASASFSALPALK